MYIVFLNPQGNFDRNDSYWTMHPDFGGQLVYVKEIAIEMAKLGHKIDIITRKFEDESFPEFNADIDSYPEIDNLRIVRIPCGPNKFLTKELLWEYLDEWTSNIIKFYEAEGSLFDFATGHYGDGGLVCAMIKARTNIPYSFTGHSLGAQKFDKLDNNFLNFNELEQKYHFTKRILAERTAIKYSDIIFVSTSQEKDNQYSHKLYEYGQTVINSPNFIVAPPGANTQVFAPFWSRKIDDNLKEKIDNIISRDITEKRKNLPFIVFASRLDHKKNHIGLVEAYSENLKLQKRSNLLISLRGVENAFDDYSGLSEDEKIIIDRIMDIIDKKSLHGKVMFISINSQFELANTYRYMALKRSVFTLTALYEPFGLAPIEAMSTGLPVAVTKYGGPSEVLKEGNKEFGVLLDVHDLSDICKGLNELFDNYDYYQEQGVKRVHSKYTWRATANTYLKAISEVKRKYLSKVELPKYFESKDLKDLDLNFIKKIYSD
jgi:sucrose-phosphate synthase